MDLVVTTFSLNEQLVYPHLSSNQVFGPSVSDNWSEFLHILWLYSQHVLQYCTYLPERPDLVAELSHFTAYPALVDMFKLSSILKTWQNKPGGHRR